MTRDDVLISAPELARRLDAGDPVTILDVRWKLGDPDGSDAYREGHIPGAVYVSLEDELSDHSVPGRGRHPLPSGRDVAASARRWGLRDGVPVVVYDDWNRAGSARAWWVLIAAGVPDVRILDGGLVAWRAIGGAVDAGEVNPEPGDIRRAIRLSRLVTAAATALAAALSMIAVDLRAHNPGNPPRSWQQAGAEEAA